jgi:lysophospholipase L1-like esterase
VPNPENPPVARKRRWPRRLGWLAAAVIILLIAAELILRFHFGLGDPPLSMFDPDMEYRFQPNQTVHRFGNLIHYNAYSQRADDFPEHKSSSDELRVMFIGDSVINGGNQTDQSQLVTQILQRRLTDELHRKVIVGNASASSWGPPNELAYVNKFGLVDADVVVLVFNDEDAFDAMTFNPVVGIRPDFPNRKPLLALTEAWTRYLPMFTARFKKPPPPDPTVPDEQALSICMDAIRQLVEIARSHGARVLIAEHHALPRFMGAGEGPRFEAGREHILQTSRELGIEPIQWSQQFEEAMRQGKDPYRAGDYMHPSAVGVQIMVDVLLPKIREALVESTTQPTH